MSTTCARCGITVLPETRLSKAGFLSRSETHCRSEQTSTQVFCWRKHHRSQKTHFSSPNMATSSLPRRSRWAAFTDTPSPITSCLGSHDRAEHLACVTFWSKRSDLFFDLNLEICIILWPPVLTTSWLEKVDTLNIDSVPVWVRQNTYKGSYNFWQRERELRVPGVPEEQWFRSDTSGHKLFQ